MTGFKLYLVMAFRNLWRHPRRTILNLTAIAFGLACLIVFQALKEGLHLEMLKSTVNLETASLQVRPAKGLFLKNASELVSRLKVLGLPLSPRLRLPALALHQGEPLSVLLCGIDPSRERHLTIIARRVVAGTYEIRNGLLIGSALAEKWHLKVGDRLRLVIPTPFGVTLKKSFPVEGIYRTELRSFDLTHLYLPLKELQQWLGLRDQVTEIALLTPYHQEASWARRIRPLVSPHQVLTWEEVAPEVKQIMDINDATLWIMILIVFAIVALGIANTVTTSIFERFRELGILSALGTPPEGLVGLLLLEGSMLGLLACLGGSLLGLAVSLYFHRYGLDLSSLTSANQHLATSHVLHAEVRPVMVLVSNAVTLLTVLAGSLFPALKVARLDPLEAIYGKR